MLKRHLKDETYSYIIRILIPTYLKSFYSLKGNRKKSDKGIPQGGALAYFLSNLYLNDLDHNMKEFTKFNYIRYVDDIRILGKTKQEVEKSLLYLQAHLWELGLEINAGKTKVYKVEDDEELEEFRKEQKEKLSPLQDESDEELYKLLQQYKDEITKNEKIPQAKGDFKELEKLRKRKVNFAANNLIRKGDPASFPLLVSQMDTKPEKVTYLLEKLFNYRFKEKNLNVVSINSIYLDRPYEIYVGAAIANLHNWNIKLRDELGKVIPSDTGIVELYLLNTSKSQKVEIFILTTVINKCFNRLERTNPYLINSIIYHMSRSTGAKGIGFSTRFKSAIIDKIIEKNIYETSNCGQFIVDAFLKDSSLLEQFENSNEKMHIAFFNFLRREYQELYKLLIAKNVQEAVLEPSEGFFTLHSLHATFNSVKDIYIFLKKVITLIKNNNQYMNNPTFVNSKNLWIKTSIYHDMEVRLNPNPVKDRSLYLSAPEEFFDRQHIKNELKISFRIGLIAFSLFLKEMDKINSLNSISLQFNPKRVWKNNSDAFKEVYSKDIILKSPIQEVFYELLSIIEKLTKKNPRSRLSILSFNDYLENKKGDEKRMMKFFISHSTKDKGRITPYINLIESNEKKHKALLDTHEFIPGKSIIGEITKKIDESDIVIVFYSRNVAENFKWVMEEVEYCIEKEKPFVCVLLDDIRVPPLLKGEIEKINFVHKDNISIKEIQSFLYKLEGMDVEEIKSKLNLEKSNPAYRFIQYLNEKEVAPLNMLLSDKFFNIFDVLTKSKECKLTPASIFKTNLDGTDINALPYQEIIDILKFFELIETQDSGPFVIKLKLQNSSFHSCIREAKDRYGLYWKEYFRDAIKIEEYKNQMK
ncbi:TIR domain-containing protein [Pradoshia sp. D12]|nr:TIR domain-containing protein [Pradoshia sp. D12]TPF73410.1 TIR domain-containing protein [Bacillus sp. D12]